MMKHGLRAIQATGIYRRLDIVVWRDPDSHKESTPPLLDIEVDLLGSDRLEDLITFRPELDAATVRRRLALGHSCFLAGSFLFPGKA